MTAHIPLLDLGEQYDTIRDEVDAAIRRVVDSQRFILGPEVEAFEQALAAYLDDGREVVGCASGTDALLLSLKALDLEPGDEVIVPAFTFFATAGAVWNAGLKPVFCDVESEHFNLTARTVAEVWTERTRAVIAVHLFGQMAVMDELVALAEARGASLIEDAAQSIGAAQEGAPRGVATALSFFPSKNLGGFGDGGAVTSADPDFADRLRKLRVHGGHKMYHHEMVGTNSRLDALQAAVLAAKLPHLTDWTDARRLLATHYGEALADIPEVISPPVYPGNVHVYNQYTIRVRRRDALREYLSGQGIGTGVYYPVPLHVQECFAALGGRRGQFPVSETLCEEVLSLPVYPELGTERLLRVVSAIGRFYA
ncbi:MAG: DegT/DnrJ/EryC1/StrS family aminotransferase [Gemmatimonadetes bacterium]|nr:DegT/DnrJ/EryC1/StrS family aminotransferase [Gemmatimonadota bacterium]